MLVSEKAQSLKEFRENPEKTIERLRQTNLIEMLTVDGEAQAILMSPEAFEDLLREADIANMARAIQELKEGKGQSAEVFFAQLHEELLAMKAEQEAAATK